MFSFITTGTILAAQVVFLDRFSTWRIAARVELSAQALVECVAFVCNDVCEAVPFPGWISDACHSEEHFSKSQQSCLHRTKLRMHMIGFPKIVLNVKVSM